MMQTCEDSELVRRRGRWLNQRVMEIYIQEISSMQLLLYLSKSQRDLNFSIAASFPISLQKRGSPCSGARSLEARKMGILEGELEVEKVG